MAKTRYFQHLNENNDDFQKVTTLEYIDNSQGFLMYYFKDGSKCNKNYIAPVNVDSISGYEFAEVTSPYNIWKLSKVVPKKEEPEMIQNANGEWVEKPSIEDYTNSKSIRKTRIDVIGKPIKDNNYQMPDDSEYYFDLNAYRAQKTSKKEETNFDFNENSSKNIEPAQFTEIKDESKIVLAEIPYCKKDDKTLHLDATQLMNGSIDKVLIHFKDNQVYEMSITEFIENAITPKEEKVVEKVVEKEVLVKTSDTDIDLGVDSTQKGLLDNMIDMSNKMECAIDMELTLKLPPASVYKLIKSVYPEGMDRGFVNIIANRMQVKELKTSVADGLMAFYDDEYNNEVSVQSNTSNVANNDKKPGRKKQTV